MNSEVKDMTLRDWFAGQALTGIMANSKVLDNANIAAKKSDVDGQVVIGIVAYVVADAMMAEREERFPFGRKLQQRM